MTTSSQTKPVRTQALRFALLSGLSFGVNLSLTVLLTEQGGLNSLAAVPIAMACVTLMNFAALRWFVFGHDGRSIRSQLAGFVVSIVGFRIAEYLAFALLHGLLHAPYLLTYACILVVSLVCKFLILRGTVFRGKATAECETAQAG